MKHLRPRRVLAAVWIVLGVIALFVSFWSQGSVYRGEVSLLGVALLAVHSTQAMVVTIWIMGVWFEDRWWPF